MSNRQFIAPIRFGLGLRLGETPPTDPEAWLELQLARPGPPPTGLSTADALRAVVADRQVRRTVIPGTPARDRTAPPLPPGAPPRTPQEEAAARDPLGTALREEARLWAERRLTSDEPFRERLVDFWANHFTVSRRKTTIGALSGPLEREAIRPNLDGRFADMLVAVTRHPAMLLYLDNNNSIGPHSPMGQRRGSGLNENLAREVLELHSLSPAGGYTQGDVQELAKILTGWSVALNREPFGFLWRPVSHEPGDKTLLGRRFREGEGSQEAALRMLGTHPATYRHIAAKLARHFVADDPPPEAVSALEETLRRTEGDLGAVHRRLITLPQAWDKPLSKFRAPKDYVLAVVRAVSSDRPREVLSALAALNQPLFSASQPNGWPDRFEDWAGSEALMRRADWIYSFAARHGRVDPVAVTNAALGPLASAETVDAMRGAGSVRDALTLLFCCPEFMNR